MLDLVSFNDKINKNNIDNCYIFVGQDEGLIKNHINLLIEKVISEDFLDLNFTQFDGNNIESINTIINACETLPFMSERKVVLIYRAAFLKDGEDRAKAKLYGDFVSYIENLPPHSVLILYEVLESKRDKIGSKIMKLDKKCTIVDTKIERRYKKEKLLEYITAMFKERNKAIGKIELEMFYNEVKEDNLNEIENEVEKLCCYCIDRDIVKDDIKKLKKTSSDDDIFDMVDFLSQRKINKALDILNELIFKGEKTEYILYMVERQFKLLLMIKLGMEQGKNSDQLARELKLNKFICQNMAMQSKKFNLKQLKNAIEACLNTEQRLKSLSTDKKIEMEVLLVKAMAG